MKARVYVTLKPSVFDPQGRVVADALVTLGYQDVKDVRQGKFFEVELTGDPATAKGVSPRWPTRFAIPDRELGRGLQDQSGSGAGAGNHEILSSRFSRIEFGLRRVLRASLLSRRRRAVCHKYTTKGADW